jgi:hypothetical protein
MGRTTTSEDRMVSPGRQGTNDGEDREVRMTVVKVGLYVCNENDGATGMTARSVSWGWWADNATGAYDDKDGKRNIFSCCNARV